MSTTAIAPPTGSGPGLGDLQSRPFDNTRDALAFTVRGLPAPQGSKSFKGLTREGRAILAESSAKVRPWRQDVVAAAIDQIERTPGFRAYTGAVHLIVEFYMPRPKGDPKTRRTIPAKMPDLSKLVRSTEDALKTAGVWADDALVTEITTRKRYAVLDPDLGHPWELPGQGAVITVVPVAPEATWADQPLAATALRSQRQIPEPIRRAALTPAVFVVDDWGPSAFIVPADTTTAKAVKIVERACRSVEQRGDALLVIEDSAERLVSYLGQPNTPLQLAVQAYAAGAGERPPGKLLLPDLVVW